MVVGAFLIFAVPLIVLIVGLLVFFLKPKHRTINSALLIAIGVFEILFWLGLTQGHFEVTAVFIYTIEILTIIVGAISVLKAPKHKETQ